MVHQSIVDCIGRTPLVYLRRLFPARGVDVIAKLELLNPGGSVKDRPARYIVEQGLRDGTIRPDTELIESSSGNFGIALAMVARAYNLGFTCVVDPHISLANLRMLGYFGARIEMVEQPDPHGSFLETRIRRVHELSAQLPSGYWINQYANQLNWQAHYDLTAAEIIADLDAPIDCLVVAVSTTGTILGLARRLRRSYPALRVVAVDAAGSVIFGGPSAPRALPGIGANRVPELLNPDEIDQVVYVNDREALHGCRELVAREGIFAGGSSGAVVAAISRLLPSLVPPCRVLTLLPDRGERYLDTVYDHAWPAQLPSALYVPSVEPAGELQEV